MFKAVVDANALYPLYLRDLLLDFSQVGAFQVRGSRMILDEVQRALDKRHPEHARRHASLLALMDEVFPSSMVELGEAKSSSFGCRDPHDEHVMAAAVSATARLIVTFNLRDFPHESESDFGVTAIHPDDFLLSLLIENEPFALKVIYRRLGMYSRPNLDARELALRLQKSACPKSAEWIHDHRLSISQMPEARNQSA